MLGTSAQVQHTQGQILLILVLLAGMQNSSDLFHLGQMTVPVVENTKYINYLSLLKD